MKIYKDSLRKIRNSILSIIIIGGSMVWPSYTVESNYKFSSKDSYTHAIYKLRQDYNSGLETTQLIFTDLGSSDRSFEKNMRVSFGLGSGEKGNLYVNDVEVQAVIDNSLNWVSIGKPYKSDYQSLGTGNKNLYSIHEYIKSFSEEEYYSKTLEKQLKPKLNNDKINSVYAFCALTMSEAARFNNQYRDLLSKSFGETIMNQWNEKVTVYTVGGGKETFHTSEWINWFSGGYWDKYSDSQETVYLKRDSDKFPVKDGSFVFLKKKN